MQPIVPTITHVRNFSMVWMISKCLWHHKAHIVHRWSYFILFHLNILNSSNVFGLGWLGSNAHRFVISQPGRMIILVDFVKVKLTEPYPKAKAFACACQQMNDVETGWPFLCDELELGEPAVFYRYLIWTPDSIWFNLISSARLCFFGIQIADEEMMTLSACCSYSWAAKARPFVVLAEFNPQSQRDCVNWHSDSNLCSGLSGLKFRCWMTWIPNWFTSNIPSTVLNVRTTNTMCFCLPWLLHVSQVFLLVYSNWSIKVLPHLSHLKPTCKRL